MIIELQKLSRSGSMIKTKSKYNILYLFIGILWNFLSEFRIKGNRRILNQNNSILDDNQVI